MGGREENEGEGMEVGWEEREREIEERREEEGKKGVKVEGKRE